MKKGYKAMEAAEWSKEAEARIAIQTGKKTMRYNSLEWLVGNVVGLTYDRETGNLTTWIFPVVGAGDEIDFQRRIMIDMISKTDLDLIGIYWTPDNRKQSPQALKRKCKVGIYKIAGNHTIFFR